MIGTDKTNVADDNKTFDLGLRMIRNKENKSLQSRNLANWLNNLTIYYKESYDRYSSYW